MQNETRVLRGARLNQRLHLSHYLITATNPYPPPPMLTLHTHPSPLQPVLEGPDKRSIKGLFLNESVFTNDSCSHPFALAIYSPHPLSPPFYTGYMFSIILPSIPTTNTQVNMMLSASWQSSGWLQWWYMCLCGLAGEGEKQAFCALHPKFRRDIISKLQKTISVMYIFQIFFWQNLAHFFYFASVPFISPLSFLFAPLQALM